MLRRGTIQIIIIPAPQTMNGFFKDDGKKGYGTINMQPCSALDRFFSNTLGRRGIIPIKIGRAHV